jgi:hypothetical protein
MADIVVRYAEGQRQMVLLALAKLSIERPGWEWALEQIALKMDNRIPGDKLLEDDKAEMFRVFRKIHAVRGVIDEL